MKESTANSTEDSSSIDVPNVYQEFLDCWETPDHRDACIAAYQDSQVSFIPNLLPQFAVEMSADQTFAILRQRLGIKLDVALDPQYTDPDKLPDEIPKAIQSPMQNQPNGNWLKQTNMVGINTRTIHSFWNIVKYALTRPAAQDSIHILPIWEPGVVGSLYGMSSWQINPEFFSTELAQVRPELNTVERQLRACVNLLHVLGKAVGMDVIPHTDRFCETAFAYPDYYEWLQREDLEIVDHSDRVYEGVQKRVLEFLAKAGAAVAEEPTPVQTADLYGEAVGEAQRLRILFGKPKDYEGRLHRRIELVKHLYLYGYEPVPATMAPPFRGMAVDSRDEAKKIDENGLEWRDYVITKPESMSRVFGPLARYKFYERFNDNVDWEVDFSRPRAKVWDYVCNKYYQVQHRYGFDFMRGDMSHVQMRAAGVPTETDDYYDPLRAVKNYIQRKGVPYFGYFAETFMAPKNIMTYGHEIDHLEASHAESTLGDLQSSCVGDADFTQRFIQYRNFLETRDCAPNFTIFTADKDDPRFDKFFVKGSATRLFIAFFLTDMPSYSSLGWETRDIHLAPAPNEHYTKLFVFQEKVGPKATEGSYIWGKNGAFFHVCNRLKLYLDTMWNQIQNRPVRWLIRLDPMMDNKLLAWTQDDDRPDYVFVVNLDIEQANEDFSIPAIPGIDKDVTLEYDFSTASHVPEPDHRLTSNGKSYRIAKIDAGEGRVYRLITNN